MKKVLLSLLLLTFVFAQTDNSYSTINKGIQTLKENYSFIMLIILFTFVLSVFIYSIGKFLNMGSIKSWAKDQIYESFLSLFIGVFVVFLLENFFLNQNFGGLLTSYGLLPQACKSETNLFSIGECELNEFFKNIDNLLWNIFAYDLLFSVLGTCGLSFEFSIPPSPALPILKIGIGTSLLSPLMTDLSDFLSEGYYILLVAYLLNFFQFYLIQIAPYFFLYFFPIGVVLRSFSLTRKVGGSIIAISLGISILYPILAAIGYGYILSAFQFNIPSSILSFTSVGGTFIASILSWIYSYSGKSIIGILSLFIFIGSLIPSLISLVTFVFPILFGSITTLAPVIIGLLIVPYIIFDVIENFIRGLSSQIGQEVSVLGAIGRIL
ncbi:MAG: hypothetical protein ACP5FX_01220 [Candidatus Micrarchaeia archaeon]